MFAWDEAKRLTNLRKHGIDFRDAQKIFRLDGDQLVEMKRMPTRISLNEVSQKDYRALLSRRRAD